MFSLCSISNSLATVPSLLTKKETRSEWKPFGTLINHNSKVLASLQKNSCFWQLLLFCKTSENCQVDIDPDDSQAAWELQQPQTEGYDNIIWYSWTLIIWTEQAYNDSICKGLAIMLSTIRVRDYL